MRYSKKNLILLILWILSTVIFISPAFSKERAEICAKYQTSDGWSDYYKVEATITDGNELNQATSSYNYQPLDKYVVIFWEQNQASVIKMNSYIIGPFEENGYDQQGREWQIKKSSWCF